MNIKKHDFIALLNIVMLSKVVRFYSVTYKMFYYYHCGVHLILMLRWISFGREIGRHKCDYNQTIQPTNIIGSKSQVY